MRRVVWNHYRVYGRHNLPWRHTTNPYHILVSEIMLQQTQVSRVISKYLDFMARYPTVETLADASLREVLLIWQGLGYNRRAKMLHDTAQYVHAHLGGTIPHTYESLLQLPGIGPYTAGAVCVFAHNAHHALVETNVRTVLFHHLYAERTHVTDDELRVIAHKVCPKKRAREWYWALMDYGAYLKGLGVRVNSKNPSYRAQSLFKGSDRYIRGAIVRLLATEGIATEQSIFLSLKEVAPTRMRTLLKRLENEGLIQHTKDGFSIVH